MSDPLYLVNADALDELRVTAPATIRCCVTSPPYFGLRNYGVAGQIGMERTVTEYVEKLVAVFAEVRRVLTDDGTLWLNLGDSYAGSGRGSGDVHSKNRGNEASRIYGSQLHAGFHESARHAGNVGRAWTKPPEGLKPKDLIGIPWRVAFALQAAGWWLREDIIWHKRNCMPESVRDRCTRSHEYIFHFAKSENYFHNQAAIKEPCIYTLENDHGSIKARKVRAQSDHKSAPTDERNGIRPTLKDARTFDGKHADKQRGHSRRHDGFNDRWDKMEREVRRQWHHRPSRPRTWSPGPSHRTQPRLLPPHPPALRYHARPALERLGFKSCHHASP
jgi:DNA modification methylase